MTVSTTDTRNVLAGNGVATSIPTTFEFLEDGDLIVTLYNSDDNKIDPAGNVTGDPLTISTHYTVAGGGDGTTPATGTVNLTFTPATGQTVVVERLVALTQLTDLQDGTPFRGSTQERQYDLLAMMVQQLNDALALAPVLPSTRDPSLPRLTLPPPEAGQYIIGNASATGYDNSELLDTGTIATPLSILNGGFGSASRYVLYAPLGSATNVGCFADGVTDDTTRMQALIDELGVQGGGILDLGGQMYRIDSTLEPKAFVEIRNGKIDFSNAASGDRLFEASGSLENSEALTSGLTARTDYSFGVADASAFSEDDVIWMESDDNWYDDDDDAGANAVTLALWLRIKSISGNTITVQAPSEYGFSTGDNSTVQRLAAVKGIRLRDLRMQGAGTTGGSQYAIKLDFCQDVLIENCEMTDFNARGVWVGQCYGVEIRGCSTRKARTSGSAYGISVVSGCGLVNIHHNRMEDCRHGVTIAGSNGLNQNIIVDSNIILASYDAGVDTHPSADQVTISNNVIMCAFDAVQSAGAGDGIISQGGNVSIIGNTVRNMLRAGIFYQSGCDFTHSVVIANNIVHSDGSGVSNGIRVTAFEGTEVFDVVISGNIIGRANDDFDTGIYVDSDDADIRGLTIVGNRIRRALDDGIRIDAGGGASTFTIERCAITGNSIEAEDASGNNGIRLTAAANGDLMDVAVVGNAIVGGDYNVSYNNVDHVTVVGNTLRGAGTGETNGTGTNTNVTVASNA